MAKINTTEWQANALQALEDMDLQLQSLQSLSLEALQKAPGPEKWNALECIEHLNRTWDHYGVELKKSLQKSQQRGDQPVNSFKSSWLGRSSVKRLKPVNGEIPKPMKTFGNMDPLKDQSLRDSAIEELLNNHKVFTSMIHEAVQIDPGSIKVQSLIKMIRFRLGDAIDFVIAHEQRHLLQALRAAGVS